ncbi:hypothetical protein SteCoe_30365 [Stentor coeruleus]|uniref:Uncharacterized protein n=1 Tax=Stentor coeruleus TaxID=5963 RepID=A0A1R2B3R2_9CILI|nr:hypothetical protein SteCoe_30365 [Stentor coeruleus]
MGTCTCWPGAIRDMFLTPQGGKSMQTAPSVQIPNMHPRVYVLAEKVFSSKADTIDSVDLKDRDIGEDGGRYLSAILPYLKNIVLLNLQFTSISTNAWELIFQGLGEINSLRHLDVSRNALSEKNIMSLSASIVKHMNLEALILDSTTLSSTSMIDLGKSLVSLPKLKILSLSSNTISDIGLITLSNSLTFLSDLQFLDISANTLTSISIPYLSTALPHLSQLKVLKLGDNPIKDQGLLLIIQVLEANLEELGLNNIGMSAKGLQELCSKLPSMRNLTYLYLDYNLIDQKPMKILIDILPKLNLKHLSLVGCDVSNHRKALSLAHQFTEVLI